MTPPTAAALELGRESGPPAWPLSGFESDLSEVWTLIEAQRRRIEELELLATRDELTGLANRRGLIGAISAENERIARGQSTGAMLIAIDLNHFKDINDTFGHDAGDTALRAVGATLLGFIRTTDHAARLGGDEFVLLLTHTTPSQLTRRLQVLDQLLNDLTIEWRGRPIAIRSALGSTLLDGRQSAASLLGAADEAMYANKRLSQPSKNSPDANRKIRARQVSEPRFPAAPSSMPSDSERIPA